MGMKIRRTIGLLAVLVASRYFGGAGCHGMPWPISKPMWQLFYKGLNRLYTIPICRTHRLALIIWRWLNLFNSWKTAHFVMPNRAFGCGAICVFSGKSKSHWLWRALLAFGVAPFSFGSVPLFIWWWRPVVLVATNAVLVVTAALRGLSPPKPQSILPPPPP